MLQIPGLQNGASGGFLLSIKHTQINQSKVIQGSQ